MFEEKYFSDPLVFSLVRESEDRLIGDYLENRLSASERERFEKRYLAVPELVRRVDAVRRSPPSGTYRLRLQLVFVGLALVACVSSWWFLSRSRPNRPAETAHSAQPALPDALPTVHLVPGVSL